MYESWCKFYLSLWGVRHQHQMLWSRYMYKEIQIWYVFLSPFTLFLAIVNVTYSAGPNLVTDPKCCLLLRIRWLYKWFVKNSAGADGRWHLNSSWRQNTSWYHGTVFHRQVRIIIVILACSRLWRTKPLFLNKTLEWLRNQQINSHCCIVQQYS